MKHTMKSVTQAVTLLLLTGCSTPRPVMQVVERITHDTLYLSTARIDSTYLHEVHYTDYRKGQPYPANLTKQQSSPSQPPDTVVIHHTTTEYRYRLLRDTLYRIEHDSVPVIQEVEVVREVSRTPWQVKALALAGALLLLFRWVRRDRYR